MLPWLKSEIGYRDVAEGTKSVCYKYFWDLFTLHFGI